MKLLAGFIALFWLSLIAAVVVWWQRTVPRRPASDGWVAPVPDPADQVQHDAPWMWWQDGDGGFNDFVMLGPNDARALGVVGGTTSWTADQVARLLRDIRAGETSVPER